MRFFHTVACFFQHGDPHETLYFTIRKLLFHFSRFCVFSKKTSKKALQNRDHVFSLKNHPKVVPGDPFWDPKRSRINVGEVKKPKNGIKKSILDTVGFRRFFKLKKALASRFSGTGPSRKSNSKSIEPSRDLISSALSIKSSRSP